MVLCISIRIEILEKAILGWADLKWLHFTGESWENGYIALVEPWQEQGMI